MGVKVNKNDKGEFQLVSTNTDKLWHDKEWISENEAKVLLINSEFFKFVEKIIEIDMTFPKRVNGEFSESSQDFNRWMLDAMYNDNVDEIIKTKFEEIYERLGLTFKI